MIGLLRFGCLLPSVLVCVLVAALATGVLLAFRGSPGQCGGGRDIDASFAQALAYDQRWVRFNTQLTSGRAATLAVSESEATSRARLFLGDTGAPVDGLRVCFVDGKGDINAVIDTPFGADVAVRVKGSADLSDRHPGADIDTIQVGGLPGWVTRPFHGLITRIVDDQMDQIELDHRLTVELGEGEAIIRGEP